MGSPWLDLRTGARALRTTPGQSLAAVLALSLGVAAAVTLYTAFRVLADDLPPIPHPERVARLYFADATAPVGRRLLRAGDVNRLTDELAGRAMVATLTDDEVTVEIDGCASDTSNIRAQQASPEFFEIAGVRPQLGRTWTAEELKDRFPVILSADLWRRACAADPGVIGRTARINRRPYEVEGVMPDGFWLSNRDTGLWLPIERLKPDETPSVFARLSDTGTWQHVNARFAAGPPPDHGLAIALTDPIVRRSGQALVGLLAPALLVLLVACGNAAALLIGRAVQRERDLAVRLCVGATPWRLARQAFAETAVVAGVAGLAALPLAAAGTGALRHAFAPLSPAVARLIVLDGRAFAFALAIVAGTAILTGLLPAFRAARADITSLLSRSPGRVVVRRGHYTAADLLVVLQVALAVVLLVVTAMFLRLFGDVAAGVSGRPDRTFVAEVATLEGDPPSQASLRQAISALREVPGVAAIAVADHPPEPAFPVGPTVEALDAPPRAERCWARVSAVTGEYFDTFAISLRAGSLFTGWESSAAPRVAVVSEGMARLCWGEASVVGRRLRFGGGDEAPWLVVGVVSDVVRETRLRPKPVELYVPFAQAPAGDAVLVVETRSAAGMTDRLSEATDTNVLRPLRWRTVSDDMTRQLAGNPLPRILQVLAGLALVLATLGVYASISQSLARDRRSLAIRLALGAQPGRLVGVGVGRQGLLALVGIFAGVLVTVAATTQMWGALLQMVGPDPRLWLAVCGPLLACGLVASLGPMIRIVRLDPIAVLRRADE